MAMCRYRLMMAMTGKYLLFGLWIQLWMPIMAIINLYLHMAIARDLDALQNTANLDLPSILSLYKLDFLLQDYLATGGMLAASTPAISLMLIYGSAITATHLAGRLQEHGCAVLAIDGPVHGLRQVGPGGREAFAVEAQREGFVDNMVEDWYAALAAMRGELQLGLGALGYFGLSMGEFVSNFPF